MAFLGGQWASNLLEVTSDLSRLDESGRWAVVLPYSGPPVCARFAQWSAEPPVDSIGEWVGPPRSEWATSMDEVAYVSAVEETREAIASGTVYQANVCRVLTAPLPDPSRADVAALQQLLAAGNPSPFGGFLRLPESRVHVATASPELFLSVTRSTSGRTVRSGPIKGTGRTAADLTAKDAAENVMIVDLMRNDLSRVSDTGSVTVPELLAVQEHPGLVHLVSYVEGRLEPSVRWPQLVEATFPPGSVTGTPKLSALRLIAALEPEPRSFYCGALGWVDADTGEAEFAVTIRTFWLDGPTVKFGTGAGITWGSDATAEWQETELKSGRLIGVAAGTWPADPSTAWQADPS